jgi:flagellar biosynthesis protein FlhG
VTYSQAGQGTRIISVGGGKGGVGKSLVSTNLAVTFAAKGLRVVLADLDLGAANLHLMLGVKGPRPGVAALLHPQGEDLAAALTPTPIPNLRLLAGTGAVLGAANINRSEKLRMLRKLRSIDADVVVVDVGAGVGYNALDFFELGGQRVVVATPQVTSIHDAYSFLKGAVLRILKRLAVRTGEAALLRPAESSAEGEKVSELLARIRDQNPEFAAKIFGTLQRFGAYMIGNQVTDPAQANVFHSVSKMMLEYLGISVPILGWIRANPRMHESVNQRSPFVLGASAEETRAFRAIAEALLVEEIPLDEELIVEEEPDLDAAPPERAAPPPVPRVAAPTLAAPPPPAPAAPPPAPAPPKVFARPYIPPTRQKRPEKKAKDEAPGRRRRRLTLPGMTPRS